MFVYRVQNQGGRGPYNPEIKPGLTKLREHGDQERWPIPANDGIHDHHGLKESGLWVCGFRRKKDAKTWFSGAFRQLEKCGYKFIKFWVPKEHVKIGKKQVTFLIAAATPVKVWRPR